MNATIVVGLSFPSPKKILSNVSGNLSMENPVGWMPIVMTCYWTVMKLCILLSFFNKILLDGYYPDIWRNNLILPINKGGLKTEPNKYRGLQYQVVTGSYFS